MGAGGGQLGAGIASVVGGIVACCIPGGAVAGVGLIGGGAGLIANGAVTMENKEAMDQANKDADKEADRQKRLGFDNALKGMVAGATSARTDIARYEKKEERIQKNGTDDNRYAVRVDRQQAFMGKPVSTNTNQKYS